MKYLLAIAVLAALVFLASWAMKQQQRRRLEAQFRKLAARAARPVNPRLESRRAQVAESIGNVLANLKSGSSRPADIARVLPKFHQQIARLEQDQRTQGEAESSRGRLRKWLDRLDGHPPGSDHQELREVVRKAYRIASGLVDEGDLEGAVETAVNAEILVKKQYEALEATRARLEGTRQRIEQGVAQAEKCNAPILVRVQWERLMAEVADLEGLARSGKLSEALGKANRVLSLLDELSADLEAQLTRQIQEHQAQAAAILADLLMWPPDDEAPRAAVHEMLDRLEQPSQEGKTRRRGLDEAREQLELAHAWVERSVALAGEHETRWKAYVATLEQRLKERPLGALDGFQSLPRAVVEAREQLERRRARLQARGTSRRPWHLAEDIEEILQEESALFDEVVQTIARLETRVGRLSDTFRTAGRLSLGAVDFAEPLQGLATRFSALRHRLEKRDLETLESDIVRLEEDLAEVVEKARRQGLDRGRKVLEVLEQALQVLEKGELFSHAGTEGEALRSACGELEHHIAREDVIAVLEIAAAWEERAPTLVEEARCARNQARVEDLLARAAPPPELKGLVPDTRREVEQALAEIRIELTGATHFLNDDQAIDRICAEVEQRLTSIAARTREELSSRFQESYDRHAAMLAKLTRSTVQFYLPDDAHEALATSRRLEESCRTRAERSSMDTLEATLELVEQGAVLQALWQEALPRARRFYSRQLNVIGIELDSVTPEGLPDDVTTELERLRGESQRLAALLETDRWEEVAEELDDLAGQVRALSDRADALRGLYEWHQAHEPEALRLVERLRSVGCDQESRRLSSCLEAWSRLVQEESSTDRLRELRAELESALAEGERAVASAVEEIERSRREQGELENWRQILALRKQDLDWARSSLKNVLGLGPEGMDLRRGLGILQALQRSLDIVGLDLDAAAHHDQAFQDWLQEVRSRAERRFLDDFQEVLDALHERPASMKALCAEALTHVDSVLSTGFIDDEERVSYERLQALGDDYHKLFARRFSFEQVLAEPPRSGAGSRSSPSSPSRQAASASHD